MRPRRPEAIVTRPPRPRRAVASLACLRRAVPPDLMRAAWEHSMTSGARSKRYGVVSHEQRHAMSGLEFVQCLVSGTLPLNNMVETLGYDIVEATSGRVAITSMPTSRHLNPAGGVHGGLAAVHSTLEKGFDQTTLEFKISLVRAVTPETGLIRAEGRVISRGRRVGTAEGRLTDAEGCVLAHGTTTCLIFEP